MDREGAVHGAADLVVEVLSPSNRDYDRNVKRKQYMERGVAELWVADADQDTVEVWRPGAELADVIHDTLGWEVAGHRFEISLEEVFRG